MKPRVDPNNTGDNYMAPGTKKRFSPDMSNPNTNGVTVPPPPAPAKMDAGRRRMFVLELRKSGASFAAIGQRLGLTENSVRATYNAAIRGLPLPTVTDAKILELERLDALQVVLWPMAREGNVAAIDRILKIMEQRAKLLGLNAPTKMSLEGTGDDTSVAMIQARIEADPLLQAAAGSLLELFAQSPAVEMPDAPDDDELDELAALADGAIPDVLDLTATMVPDEPPKRSRRGSA